MTRRFAGADARWVTSGSAELYAETAGAGPPLLLIHGWPLDMRIFTPQVGPLSRHRQVVVYDRRGFGRSRGEPDLALELDDIDRLLDAFGIDSTHLLGMSQGARIALRYAAVRRPRLRSLILQGTVVDGLAVEESEEERIPLDEYADLARRGRVEEVRKRWLEHPMMAFDGAEDHIKTLLDAILNEYRGADLRTLPAEGYPSPVDVPGTLGTLDLPVLLLTGVRDAASRRAHAALLLERLPDAREVVLAGSGHLCNLAEPDIFNGEVLSFLHRVDARD